MHHARRPAPIPILVLLTLALAACGPVAPGDATRVDYAPGATYEVPAGTTLYVRTEVPLGETGLTPAAVNRARVTWIPLGVGGQSANAVTLVALADVEAPEDWDVRLWQARFVRERPLGDRDGSYAYRLEAEVRIEVPASAYDLTRRVSGELAVRGGGTVPLDVLVRAE